MAKTKSKLLVIMLCMILVTLLTQPSLAYYTVIGRATNVVTSGNIDLKIHEKTENGENFPEEGVEVIPGDIVSKEVTVENVCGHPFYLRLALVNGSDNTDINPEEAFHIEINTDKWKRQNDGYYYYHQILEPGKTTEPLFSKVEIVGSKVDQTHAGSVLKLTVKAHAVQSENNPAENP